MRVLVTGASGFAGVYLCDALRAAGHEVVAAAVGGNVDVRLDVRDRAAVFQAIEQARPRGVFHLAAVAFVPAAERAAELADAVNRGGTANVLDAAFNVGARTLVVSSGAVYGSRTDAELPATEDTDPHPGNAYARSKLAAEAECAARRSRQEIVIARPFNHTGPGQSREYVCSDFAAQLAECAAGKREARIEVGDVNVERDFSDVRDIVGGYIAAFDRGRHGETYNLCSGRATPIRRVLEILVGFSGIDVNVVQAEERKRAGEVNRFYGSYAKAERELGWRPVRSLEDTLRDLFAYWREQLGSREERA